jgi:chromosome segregation ATPase
MEKSGVSLTGELRAASEKLLEKELEISKERLKALDTASKLKRQIEELELKLQQNDGKVQTLDKELMKTKNECETLTAELLKAKETQPVVEAVLAPPVPKKRSIKKEGEDLKKAAKKEIAVKEASKEELPSASSTDTTSPSPKAKSKSKTKATKSKSTPTKKASEPEPATTTVSSSSSSSNLSSPVGTDDWSTLSKSTLTRKTVKELQDYLDGKGLTTIDSEGRPLKKALLVDAVLSS